MMYAYLGVVETAVGRLHIAVDASGAVLRVKFVDGAYREAMEVQLERCGYTLVEDGDRSNHVQRQLVEYGLGDRRQFDLPLALNGTEWQRKIWKALTDIPYGETRTYGQLAVAIGGHQRFSRAVGSANGKNPISIIVPYHRVIGADHSLTGYAGGLDFKARLLAHEGSRIPQLGFSGVDYN